jgi:hypothetical protein
MMSEHEIEIGELEQIYDSLANNIDKVGKEKHSLYLTKLVLILSANLSKKEIVLQAMNTAARDL